MVQVDGYVVLHPRRCGSASHLGVLAGMSTIGVAKALLHIPGLSEKQVRADLQQPFSSQDGSADISQHMHPDGRSARQESEPAAQLERSLPGTGYDQDMSSATERLGIVHKNSQNALLGQMSAESPPKLTHPLISQGEVLGMAVRHPNTERPVYVSVGHCISLPTAVELVRRCSRYR